MKRPGPHACLLHWCRTPVSCFVFDFSGMKVSCLHLMFVFHAATVDPPRDDVAGKYTYCCWIVCQPLILWRRFTSWGNMYEHSQNSLRPSSRRTLDKKKRFLAHSPSCLTRMFIAQAFKETLLIRGPVHAGCQCVWYFVSVFVVPYSYIVAWGY